MAWGEAHSSDRARTVVGPEEAARVLPVHQHERAQEAVLGRGEVQVGGRNLGAGAGVARAREQRVTSESVPRARMLETHRLPQFGRLPHLHGDEELAGDRHDVLVDLGPQEGVTWGWISGRG